MQIAQTDITRTCKEEDIYNSLFDFTNKQILDLGCGSASHTRKIAEAHPGCHVDACEVDKIQHDKNLNSDAPANMTFKEAGAEAIPADDNRYDIVFMFKSLHHVPMDKLDQALSEIKRVLKPGGIAYLSEPVFAGDYNEIMRLFHDEEVVRAKAFASVQKVVEQNLFQLKDEIFFNTYRKIEGFDTFKEELLGKTFVEHKLDDAAWEKVRKQFAKNENADGSAEFLQPHRVDLLQA